MSEVHLTINGQPVVAQSGQTVLEAAQAAGIDIPVLCHHPALESWGACRMCVVEVKGMRGVQTACTLPVSEGMEVQTDTENTINVRKFVLELLFSERNHYCMYCQMSGDCELQANAYRYGLDHFTYPRPYEKWPVDASRKYFIMDHNRCILCARCVRACSEIVANHTLNIGGRGANSMIIADLNVPFGESTCVECGTCLQVCPTGALIDARSAYGGREKDVTHTQTTCIQCSVGCTLDVVTRYSRLLRVDGVWDSEPGGGLICVDGRFKPLYDERKRITQPMVRRDGKLVETGWEDALALVAEKLKSGTTQGIVAAVTTNEALEAFAKLFEKIEGKAGRLGPVVRPLGFGQAGEVKDILTADYIIVAGVDPLSRQRVIGYFIKRMLDRHVPLAVIGESAEEFHERAELAVSYADAAKVVEVASKAEHPVLVYGTGLEAEAIEALKALGDKVKVLALDPAANAKGAEAVGLGEIAPNGAKVSYWLVGEYPVDESLATQANGGFTIVQASYHSPLTARADVVLPAPLWYEREGHVTNIEGRVRPLAKALPMPEGVRDDAEVLQSLLAMV